MHSINTERASKPEKGGSPGWLVEEVGGREVGDGTEKTPVAWGTNSGSKSTTNRSTYLHFTGDEE